MFYSAKEGGFFLIKETKDFVEITHEEYQKLLEGQRKGQEIVADKNGYPVLKEPELPEQKQVLPSLTARQFWQAALLIGVTEVSLTSDVSTPENPLYIEDETERKSVLIDIQKTAMIDRDHYLLKDLTKAKDISTEQLDSLWQWASQIE